MQETQKKSPFIRIRGAKVNNLKNLSVDIPRDKFVVLTGLSGSGKSSLAFDTIYAEGQRRYMESLSSYARQFLGQMEKPDVESIEGLPPAISMLLALPQEPYLITASLPSAPVIFSTSPPALYCHPVLVPSGSVLAVRFPSGSYSYSVSAPCSSVSRTVLPHTS